MERGPGGDPGTAVPRAGTGPLALRDATGTDVPAVLLQQGDGLGRVVGVGVPTVDPRRKGTGRLQRDGADGGHAVALQSLLDLGRLVDQ